jgi:hypothetical protein
MKARSIRIGTVIDGRTVRRASTGTATFAVKRSTYLAPARIVLFDDGAIEFFELDSEVQVTSGYAEQLPAGGVESKHVKTPSKVRASEGRWRGESVHGMRTREHDLLAKTNMFDFGRVNGRVGASRDGVGSTKLTGPSF